MRRQPVRASFRPRTVFAWAAVAAALGGVFMLYLQPQLAFELASRVWACF